MKIRAFGRFPRGKRGLKSVPCRLRNLGQRSLPSREAWIEIPGRRVRLPGPAVASPPREVWIEISSSSPAVTSSESRFPPREAWIEITSKTADYEACDVSLPSREAWIEIACSMTWGWNTGRFPRGKRGLKLCSLTFSPPYSCRFPRGKRGLKY